MLNGINKILIINLGGIGDILLSSPALRALRLALPKVNICILVVPRVSGFVKELGLVDEVFILEPGKLSFKNLKTLLNLRGRSFDLALNLRTIVSEKSGKILKLLLVIINPKRCAGRNTQGRGKFFDISIPETDTGNKYEMEYDIEMLERLGINVSDKTIGFKCNKESLDRIGILLKSEGINEADRLVCLHPGGEPSRRWPAENFSRAIDKIIRQVPCKFIITGSGDELKLVRDIIKATSAKVVNFAGKLSLLELSALIKVSSLLISNDTGPMHIAACLNTPLVAIFGPGDLTRYDPRNISNKAIVLYNKAPCSPCNKFSCDSMKCLSSVAVEDVVGAALKLLC